MSNWFAVAIAAIYVALMWRFDGIQSALAVLVPLSVVIALIWRAEDFAAYTGWAGRVSIRRQSFAGMVRAFAWVALLAPGVFLIGRQVFL